RRADLKSTRARQRSCALLARPPAAEHFMPNAARCSAWLGGTLAIHLTAVSDLVDGDLTRVVVNFIDHPIVALTNAVPIVIARKLLRTPWPGVLSQSGNLGYDARAILFGADTLKLFARRGLDRELI